MHPHMKISFLLLILRCVDLCISSYLPQETTTAHFREYLSKSYHLLRRIWDRRDVLLNVPHPREVLEEHLDDQLIVVLAFFIDTYTTHLRATRFVRLMTASHHAHCIEATGTPSSKENNLKFYSDRLPFVHGYRQQMYSPVSLPVSVVSSLLSIRQGSWNLFWKAC